MIHTDTYVQIETFEGKPILSRTQNYAYWRDLSTVVQAYLEDGSLRQIDARDQDLFVQNFLPGLQRRWNQSLRHVPLTAIYAPSVSSFPGIRTHPCHRTTIEPAFNVQKDSNLSYERCLMAATSLVVIPARAIALGLPASEPARRSLRQAAARSLVLLSLEDFS